MGVDNDNRCIDNEVSDILTNDVSATVGGVGACGGGVGGGGSGNQGCTVTYDLFTNNSLYRLSSLLSLKILES